MVSRAAIVNEDTSRDPELFKESLVDTTTTPIYLPNSHNDTRDVSLVFTSPSIMTPFADGFRPSIGEGHEAWDVVLGLDNVIVARSRTGTLTVYKYLGFVDLQ